MDTGGGIVLLNQKPNDRISHGWEVAETRIGLSILIIHRD